MELAFIVLGLLTLTSAIAAMAMRQLVHCVLCLSVTLAGLGGFYLLLNAEFVAFAQILVYVGAVTILVVFATLLTRGGNPEVGVAIFSSSWFKGIAVAVLAAGSLLFCVLTTSSIQRPLTAKPKADVKMIGDKLMTSHVLALEVIGLLLTAAMIGAVIIAMPERPKESKVEN